MRIDRPMSTETWKRIDDLLHRIADRAVAIKADDIYKQADMANALLRNLSREIQMEDEKAGHTSN